MSAAVEIAAPFVATERQRDLARLWHDPTARIVTAGGAIRSGKTQGAGRLLIETAVQHAGTYLVARSTYRSLKDSTQKALLHGDGSLPALIPPELIERYWASDEVVKLKTGAEILFRSLEEGQVGKLLNLTLAGILVDQIEELDDGEAGERLFDALLGRLSDPRGPRKLLAVCNPSGLTHFVYRRLVDERTRDADATYTHFEMTDNMNLPADYLAAMQATRTTRPAWYRSFVLGEWGAFEGQAFPEFETGVHVVDPFEIPEQWERFESMDHGAANPTAWHAWAVDHDGNVVVFGEHYEAGKLVTEHARTIVELRKRWHPEGARPTVYADPSTGAKFGTANKWGEPASVMTEYAQAGIHLLGANNDRQAGYVRLLELLHVEAGRIAPAWSRITPELGGAPRLYLFSTCTRAIDQLKSAPVAVDGQDAGEAVEAKWESAHGHAVASLRYGAMSRPSPTLRVRPEDIEPEDPRAAHIWRNEQKFLKRMRQPRQGRYVNV